MREVETMNTSKCRRLNAALSIMRTACWCDLEKVLVRDINPGTVVNTLG